MDLGQSSDLGQKTDLSQNWVGSEKIGQVKLDVDWTVHALGQSPSKRPDAVSCLLVCVCAQASPTDLCRRLIYLQLTIKFSKHHFLRGSFFLFFYFYLRPQKYHSRLWQGHISIRRTSFQAKLRHFAICTLKLPSISQTLQYSSFSKAVTNLRF